MATDPMLDADIKYSINKFTGNGSKTSWDLNFAGGYIRREHVKAYTQAITGPPIELSFTWSGPNTLVITPAVANGVVFTVYRDTPKSAPLVDFTDGAIINEQNLDTLASQAIFAAAEMVDRFAEVSAVSQETTETAIEALLQSGLARADATAAQAASAAAQATAGGAVATANSANTKVDGAVATANTASGLAASANATAAGAVTAANAANTTAAGAVTTAAGAVATANSANTKADGAVSTSNTANTNANDARARALDAQGIAGTAVITANNANNKADAVRSEFDDLTEAVEEIAGGDLSNFVRVNQVNNFTAEQRFEDQQFTLKNGTQRAQFRLTSTGPQWRVRGDDTTPWGGFVPVPIPWTSITGASTTDVQFRDVTVARSPADGVIYFGSDKSKYLSTDNTGIYQGGFASGGGYLWHSGNLNPASLNSSPTFTGISVTAAPGTTSAAFVLAGTGFTGAQSFSMRQGIVGVSNGGFSIRDETSSANRLEISPTGTVNAPAGLYSRGTPVWTADDFSISNYAPKDTASFVGPTSFGYGRVVITNDSPFVAGGNIYSSGYNLAIGTTTPSQLGFYTNNTLRGYFTPEGVFRVDNVMTASGNAIGSSALSPGGTGYTGYLEGRQADGTRAFYLGFADEVTKRIAVNAENGYEFNFNNTPLVNNIPVVTGFNTGETGARLDVQMGWSLQQSAFYARLSDGTVPRKLAAQNTSVVFEDVTCVRPDGSGALFMGGGAYIYHNGSDDYEFSGAGRRIVLNDTVQPKIKVGGSAPTSGQRAGDLWFE